MLRFILFLVFLTLVNLPGYPCTMILVGKNASREGRVLIAHNNDLTGIESAFIQIIPSRTTRQSPYIVFSNGCTIPEVETTSRLLMVNCYYGYTEGDAKAINNWGVSIAGGVSLKADRNLRAEERDPLVKKGMTGYIRYIALQRAHTARECIEVIGRHYSKYGISYPSGVAVADKNEIWYLEAGGGKVWAAIRIPDHSYLAVANSYRIEEIDFKDQENFILPDYLRSYLITKGLWNPSMGPCIFNKIFGGNRSATGWRYYNSRRIWRVQSLLSPSIRTNPHHLEPPKFLKPDQKIELQDLKKILWDRYENTPFFQLAKERKIGSALTVHSTIIELGDAEEKPEFCRMLTCLSSPLISPFLSFSLKTEKIPDPYNKTTEKYSSDSAFWILRKLLVLTGGNERVQKKIRNQLGRIEYNLLEFKSTNPDLFLKKYAQSVLNETRNIIKQLRAGNY